MADSSQALKPMVKPANRPARGRPDLSTLAGIAVALGGILGGLILEKGQIQDIVQMTAALIVLGGTLGAVLVTTPLAVVLRGIKGLGGIFLERGSSADATIDALIGYATKARKNGIVSIEKEAAAIEDPFMRKALNLAVDGTDLQELRKMMDTDISLSEQSAEADARVWEAAGGYAPTIGIIGAVLGLIQVMKHLEDIKEVGHGIAVAFVATVYGVGSANILKEMILEGVVGIVEGLNPSLIRMKLEAFNPNPRKPKNEGGAKLLPGAKPAAVKAPPAAVAGG
jgi:chemotaxis protein MotA